MARPLIPAALTLALLLVAPGCSRPYYVGTDGIRLGSDRPPPPSTPRSATADTATTIPLARKRVDSKEPPSTLIARDGTRCTVTASRYADIREGEYVVCAWQGGDH